VYTRRRRSTSPVFVRPQLTRAR